MSSAKPNFSYQWAKSKNAHRTTISNFAQVTSEEQIVEEMDYWKKKLRALESDSSATKTGNKEKIIDRLLDLRAQQTMLFIQNLYEQKQPLLEKKISAAVTHYYADCLRLIAATKHS